MKPKFIKIPVEQYEALKSAGWAMSNICFNLAQDQANKSRRTMDEARRAWDAAMTAIQTKP